MSNIPKGYKQTEVGVIPNDWEVDTVASTTPRNVKNGIVDGPFGSNLKTIHYRKSGIPIITSGYVTEGIFLATDYLYVDVEKFNQEKRSAVRAGDIVMAKIGARCGASAILPPWHETGILSGNALKITVDNNRHSTYYIWQVLWSLYSTGNIEALKTVGAQPAISMSNLKKYQIPLPPLPQQSAIAAALSDADALISSLEKLIAKKRNIKQGAMQELLSGKKRLPGFRGKWEVTKLGKVAEFVHGRGLSKSDLSEEGTYKCIHYGQLFTIYKELIRAVWSRTNKNDGSFYSRENDVLMPTSDVTPRGLATASCVKENGVILGGGILVIRLPPGYDGLYFSYFVTQNKTFVLKLVKGSTVFHLYANDLATLEVRFPDFQEQKTIAAVLSDMDAEIEQLEQKLDKFKMIKQGMMQELLTGKTRLI